MSERFLRWAAFAALLLAGSAHAQTRVNPDVSAIGDMRYIYRDTVAKKLAETNSTSFEFEELELNFAGYLNPYARADVFLAIHGTSSIEIEEAYGSVVRGVPFALQFRFGKYYSNFSRLLSQHPHQYAWLERPLMHTTVFGADGAPLVGARVTRLFGLGDAALTLSADAFRSDFFELEEGVEHGGEEEIGHGHGAEGGEYEIGYMGRASLFNEITDTWWLDLAASAMWAEYDPEHKLDTIVYGADAKLKWRPDSYTGVRLIAEVQVSDREVEADDDAQEQTTRVASLGAFAAAELKLRRRYDMGAFYDFVQDPFDDKLETAAIGGWIAFMPAEETIRFNLVYRNESSDFYEGSAQSLTLQVLFGLGPHKPHTF